MAATLLLSALDTRHIQVPVAAFVGGTWINPTADVTQMAFLPIGSTPGTSDWHTGSWDTTPSGAYVAQVLVGPTGGVALTRGTYAVWVKVVDNPEIPVAQTGTLTIY